MEVTGSYHCGAISYRASINPAMVNICHCTDCQIWCNSAAPWSANIKAIPGVDRQ